MHVSYRIHSSWTFGTNSKIKLVLDIQTYLTLMLKTFFCGRKKKEYILKNAGKPNSFDFQCIKKNSVLKKKLLRHFLNQPIF